MALIGSVEVDLHERFEEAFAKARKVYLVNRLAEAKKELDALPFWRFIKRERLQSELAGLRFECLLRGVWL